MLVKADWLLLQNLLVGNKHGIDTCLRCYNSKATNITVARRAQQHARSNSPGEATAVMSQPAQNSPTRPTNTVGPT